MPISYQGFGGGGGAPTGAAGEDLGGTYPNPTVARARGLRESGGTTLTMATIANGEILARSGTTVDGYVVPGSSTEILARSSASALQATTLLRAVDGTLAVDRSAAEPTTNTGGGILWTARRSADFADEWFFKTQGGVLISPRPIAGHGSQYGEWCAASGAGINTDGIVTFSTATGTITAGTPADTNALSRHVHYRNASSASANTQACQSTLAYLFRGNTADTGGFRLSFFGVGFNATPATHSEFFGAAAADPVATSNYTQLVSCFGIGGDPAVSANLAHVYNDGTGAPTADTLGADYPISTTAFYDIHIYCAPAGSSMGVVVTRRDSSVTPFAPAATTTNIPAATTFLKIMMWMTNLATASACAYRMAGGFVRTRVPL